MSNVFYNITESNYKFVYNDYEFIFSSEFYRNNFKSKYEKYLQDEKRKLDYKYNANVKCELVLLIELYRTIEKRGFLIKYKDKEIKIKDYLFKVNFND